MSKEKANKAKVLIAQGEREFNRIKENIDIGNDGKARTLARRAAGFYISAYAELNETEEYGAHFMAHLRALSNKEEVPAEVKEAAQNLLEKVSDIEITGTEAHNYAGIIINYIKEEIKKIL